MLSNERFSSMSTTIWSIFSRLISSQTGAIRWSFLFWALFVATPQRARITDQPRWSELQVPSEKFTSSADPVGLRDPTPTMDRPLSRVEGRDYDRIRDELCTRHELER